MEDKLEPQSPKAENDRRVPTAEERLSRLISGEPRMPEPSPPGTTLHDTGTENAFVPGVVHVVLKKGLDARRIAKRWAEARDHSAFGRNSSKLKDLLNDHELVNVEATFDFTPTGLEPESNPPKGRERYLTLYFKTNEDTPLISNKLSGNEWIDQATPAPKIIPPNGNPLLEPFLSRHTSGNSQWYIERCHAHTGWSLKGSGQFFSGQGVVVADLDWGFLTGHQEFKGRIEKTYNSITGGTLVNSNMGHTIHHGTAVLALLGAGANGVGMSGFAFGADLWAIQADDGFAHDEVPAFRFWWFAIDYVRRIDSKGRRKVICLEAETRDYYNIESDASINQAIRDAIAAGVVVCVPAGNGNTNAGFDKSGNSITCTGSILVGATAFDPDPAINRKLQLSNWGPRVVVSAPGDPTNDFTAGPNAINEYRDFGGTSGATPKVAGTIALMLEANPKLKHAEIRDILNATGTPITITDTPPRPIGTFLNTGEAVREAMRRAGVAAQPAVQRRSRKTSGRKDKKQNPNQPGPESRTIRPG